MLPHKGCTRQLHVCAGSMALLASNLGRAGQHIQEPKRAVLWRSFKVRQLHAKLMQKAPETNEPPKSIYHVTNHECSAKFSHSGPFLANSEHLLSECLLSNICFGTSAL